MTNEKRLIDANALMEKAEWYEDYDGCTGEYVMKKHIDVEDIANTPTVVAVEVVRCKDCKHYMLWEDSEDKCTCAKSIGLMVSDPDDFCSYGERRTNNERENNV